MLKKNKKDVLESTSFKQEALKKAIDVMRAGGTILYPTDTVWGIGCDATNQAAIKKIYAIKQRADSKAMIVLIDSTAKLQSYVHQVPDVAWELLEAAVNPLTIIYSQAKNLPSNLVAQDGSIAIRITRETISKELCERMRVPIVSTSANISGTPTPQNFSQISPIIKDAVDYIIPLRQDESCSSPSNIIKIANNGVFEIIR